MSIITNLFYIIRNIFPFPFISLNNLGIKSSHFQLTSVIIETIMPNKVGLIKFQTVCSEPGMKLGTCFDKLLFQHSNADKPLRWVLLEVIKCGL